MSTKIIFVSVKIIRHECQILIARLWWIDRSPLIDCKYLVFNDNNQEEVEYINVNSNLIALRLMNTIHLHIEVGWIRNNLLRSIF